MHDSASSALPLCIDLDGTLIKTDLLFESLARLLKQKPWFMLLVPFWGLRGRAYLKQRIARQISIDVRSLPYNSAFLEWLRSQKAAKREMLLVTAADESLANQVADHLGLFDRVIASNGRLNLKGKRKLQTLRQQVPGDFEYAGNSRADLEIWRHCAGAITIGASPSLLKRVRKQVPRVITFDGRSSGQLKHYVSAMRVQQWAKNVLVFVPLITSHQFMHPALLLKSALGFLLFSLCSSAQYILNDIVDLEVDRHHAIKRQRSFANGDVPLAMGFILAPVLLAASLGGAIFVSKLFLVALVVYFGLSLSYSLYLKKIVLLDAFVLSVLYMLRIIAGHLVTGVPFSVWLLAFAFFLFLSLAFSKRWAELNNLRRAGGSMVGRGYRVDDMGQVNLFGVCCAFLSAVVFILYLQSDKVRELYRQPELLWLLSPVFLYWVSRLWIRSSRGEMSEDSVLFVLKDPVTYVIAAVSGLIMMAATAGWAGTL